MLQLDGLVLFFQLIQPPTHHHENDLNLFSNFGKMEEDLNVFVKMEDGR